MTHLSSINSTEIHAKNKAPAIHLADLNTVLSNNKITVIYPSFNQDYCLNIPIYSSKVEAGFASPADDFVEEYLDLNNLLVKQGTYKYKPSASNNL